MQIQKLLLAATIIATITTNQGVEIRGRNIPDAIREGCRNNHISACNFYNDFFYDAQRNMLYKKKHPAKYTQKDIDSLEEQEKKLKEEGCHPVVTELMENSINIGKKDLETHNRKYIDMLCKSKTETDHADRRLVNLENAITALVVTYVDPSNYGTAFELMIKALDELEEEQENL